MADSKDSFMMEPKSPNTTTLSSQKYHKTYLMFQNILKILSIVLSAASILVTVTNKQTVVFFSIRFEARFYYSSAFKFFVAANGVVCLFSLLTLIICNLLLKPQASQRKDYFFFLFLHDLVMTLLLMAGCAAVTTVGYVGQYGEDHIGWSAICVHVNKFCKTNLASVLLAYLSFFAYLGLTILTAYKCTSSHL